MKILLLSLSLATYSFSFPVISSVGKVPVSFFEKTSWHHHHPDTMNTEVEVTDETLPTRRDVIQKQLSSVLITSLMSLSSSTTLNVNAATSNNKQQGLILDVNNSMAREFTAFPGLYPTIATKLVKAAQEEPFKSKADVYKALDSDIERERLRQYDSAIKIVPVDKKLLQYKGSQICKYECGANSGSEYRSSQIKAVQSERY